MCAGCSARGDARSGARPLAWCRPHALPSAISAPVAARDRHAGNLDQQHGLAGPLKSSAPRVAAELLLALDQAQARRDRLTDHIRELVPSWSLAWLVEALQALRGYDLINAAVMVAELGDPRRFDKPRQLMGFVGLNVSEASSGETVRRGRLTKTGNKRARKTLIEAAWTYSRPPATTSKPAAARLPAAVQQIADKARHRLSRRYRHLVRRGSQAGRHRRRRPRVAGFIGHRPRRGASSRTELTRSQERTTHIHLRRCIGLGRLQVRGILVLTQQWLRPILDLSARQPRDEPWSGGNQPTHERSINRRSNACPQTHAAPTNCSSRAAALRRAKNSPYPLN